jgi:DNA-binding PadR family transcriptional regulator
VKLRLSTQTMVVLQEFLQAPEIWRYGYDISRNAALKSGTLYPILMRLAEHKLLQTRWDAPEAGKPPRHMYKLTASGLRYARQHADSTAKPLMMRTAMGRGRS